MNEEIPKEIKYNLFTGKLLTSVLGFISSALTIYLAITLLKGIQIIFAIIALLFILLIIFLINIFLRLRTVINDYNKLVKEHKYADDNRDTLGKLLDEKNRDIELLKSSNYQLQAQKRLLYFMLFQEKKPDPVIIKQALKIEEEGLNEDE